MSLELIVDTRKKGIWLALLNDGKLIELHEEQGSTRAEVIEAENNPDLYQLEDRSSNRSHKYWATLAS